MDTHGEMLVTFVDAWINMHDNSSKFWTSQLTLRSNRQTLNIYEYTKGWQLFRVNFFLNRWLPHVLFVDGEWLYCPDDGTSKRLSSLLRLSSSLKLLNFHFLKLLHRHVKARGWRQTIHDVWVLERMKGRHPNKPNNQVFSNTNVPMDHSDAGMPYIKLPFWGWNNATNWFCFKAFATCNLHDLPCPASNKYL